MYSKSVQFARRVMSGDITWFLHCARMALKMRGPVPRPVPLASQVGTPASRNGSAVSQHGAIKAIVFSHNLDYEGASISLKELVVELFRRGKECFGRHRDEQESPIGQRNWS